MAASKHGQTTSQNLYGVGKMGASGRIQINHQLVQRLKAKYPGFNIDFPFNFTRCNS